MRCASCDKKMRRGTGRRAWILPQDDKLRSGTVCQRCAGRSIVLVAERTATIAPACAACKSGVAAFCLGCWERAGNACAELVKANIALRQTRDCPHGRPRPLCSACVPTEDEIERASTIEAFR